MTFQSGSPRLMRLELHVLAIAQTVQNRFANFAGTPQAAVGWTERFATINPLNYSACLIPTLSAIDCPLNRFA